MLDFCHLLWYVVVLQEVANFMDIIRELWYGRWLRRATVWSDMT